MNSNSSVMVFGGTGFIGYHIVQKLLEQNIEVGVLTRNPEKHRQLFSKPVHFIAGDLDTLNEEQLIELIQPYNKLIFAAGVDERVEPAGDAWEFFKRANVDSCAKVFQAAQKCNITHAVLLSSIFLQAHHQHPELKLSERHPYIRSRVEQHLTAEEFASEHFVLTTLEIPWVFGVSPHIESQWNSLITYVRSATPLMCCRGGINVVAVESVAQAAVNSLHIPTQTSLQAIGDINMSYEQLIQLLCRFSNRTDQKVQLVNDQFFQKLMQAGGLFKKIFNMPSGLDIKYLPELLMRDLFVDNTESKKLLQYTSNKAELAIEQTVLASPEKPIVKGWRKLLNFFN